MRCDRCTHLLVSVVETDPQNKPYKYSCIKNKFKAFDSMSKLGSSFLHENKTFYTEEQYRYHRRRRIVCFEKYEFTKIEFWRISLSIFALLISIISVFDNYNQREKIKSLNSRMIDIIVHKIDSIERLKNVNGAQGTAKRMVGKREIFGTNPTSTSKETSPLKK